MKNIYSFNLGHLYETLGSLSEKDRDQLLETRKEILFLSKVSQLDSILALEEVSHMYYFEEDDFKKNIDDIISFIVDEVESPIIEEIAYTTFFSSGFTPLEQLKYLLYVSGLMDIRNRVSTDLINRRCLALFPAQLKKIIDKRDEITEEQYHYDLEPVYQEVERICTLHNLHENKDDDSEFMKLNGYALRVLCYDEKICTSEWVNVIKGISSEAKKKLFEEMPIEKQILFVEHFLYREDARQEDIICAKKHVITRIHELRENNKIR